MLYGFRKQTGHFRVFNYSLFYCLDYLTAASISPVFG